jgi:TIGR03440 family protein
METLNPQTDTATAIRPESNVSQRFKYCRQRTLDLVIPLEVEDHVVQPASFVSPPKWHLAHTTWFFEEFILVRFQPNYVRYNSRYNLLFNSYYKTKGEHWIQAERGMLSRPTVQEVIQYRQSVEKKILEILQQQPDNHELHFLMELGVNHEEQHQELLLMDMKFILAVNPLETTYSQRSLPQAKEINPTWSSFSEGLYKVGHNSKNFSYDNESPEHKVYLYEFHMADRLVTNREYAEFMDDGGYQRPELWLSEGWNWLENQESRQPLYWNKKGKMWMEYTLHGMQLLDPHRPVVHINYYEASAYANWAKSRLPTEFELETYLKFRQKTLWDESSFFHPTDAKMARGQVWCWTQSPYQAYPGYQKFDGEAAEYNGKFMCNQYVLRGGCAATPPGHFRDSYRNFYLPDQRWMFSGLRLAKDESCR